MKQVERWWGTIDKAIAQSIKDARECAEDVFFDFNGVRVIVSGSSDARLILRDWSRAMDGKIVPSTVGPHPADKLSDFEVESDKRIDEQRKKRSAESDELYKMKESIKAKSLEDALSGQPEIEIVNAEAWESWTSKNTDPYGSACVRYAEKWARLMQSEIAAGKNLEDVADDTSRRADTEGITGFMFGAAVAMLTGAWKHGEALRKWHNGNYGHDGDGVVNPAVLTIGEAK